MKKIDEFDEDIKDEKKEEELFIPKTKHKFLKIMFGILLIGGLCAGGYFLYQDKFNNPKNIVKNALESSKNELSESLITKELDDKYRVNGILKVNANLGKENEKITKILNDIDLQFSGEIDPSESIANIEISTKYKNDKLIDLKTYIENNTSYILLNGIYDKYLKIESKENENEELKEALKNIKIQSKDLKTLLNSLSNAFKEEIVNYDFNKESVVITIDGKVTSVLNNYVILKNNDVNKLSNNIIKKLSNNKEAINAINNLTGEDGKELLDTLLNESNNENFVGTYRINFYTDNGIFNKKIISVRQEITQNNITSSFNIDKIEDGFIISTDMMGLGYSIKVKKNSSNINLNINVNIMEQSASIDVSVNYEKIKEITKPDISKNKAIDKLTEEDKKIIEERFSQNEVLKNLFGKIKDSVPELKA